LLFRCRGAPRSLEHYGLSNDHERVAAEAQLPVFFGLPQYFFDFHVSIFLRVKYLAAIEAFHVFDVLFTRYDAHFGVFAGGIHVGDFWTEQPVLFGKIVPAEFRLSNLFLSFRNQAAKFHQNQGFLAGQLTHGADLLGFGGSLFKFAKNHLA
jgi:hypothetical protein